MTKKPPYMTVVTCDPNLSLKLIDWLDSQRPDNPSLSRITCGESDPLAELELQETLVEGMRQRAEAAERRMQRYEIGVAGLITWLKGKGQAEAVEWVKANLVQPS